MATDPKIVRTHPVEPVFNTFRRKPLRPFYSLREFQIGLVVVAILAGSVTWVVYRGTQPDPDLFAVDDQLLTSKGRDIPVYKRPVLPWVEPGSEAAAATSRRIPLGPFPEGIISEGWRLERPPEMFDESNLYEKINGREGFYKSYGFQKLHFVSLVSTADAALSIDIELFDQGNIANALGAFSAEISNPDTPITAGVAGFSYTTRNSAFVAQGRYYARMLGSDDAEAIRAKAAILRDVFLAALPQETLPWAYEVFGSGLKLSPALVQFQKENAFSFEFADQFYSVTLPGTETEVFVSRRENDAAALALAGKLAEGFAAFGKKLGAAAGTVLVHNEYTSAVDGVRTQGRYVVGVRFATSAANATEQMERVAVLLK